MPTYVLGDVVQKGTRKSGAIFSKCGKYRYLLWRHWNRSGERCLIFLMLNPSTANELKNDPTVERCEQRARESGYDGLIVMNIFAYRSTDPNKLKQIDDPVGPKNNLYLNSILVKRVLVEKGLVVCGWGSHGKILNRGMKVKKMLEKFNIPLHYLKLTKSGEPGHPLYLGYNLKPQRWDGEIDADWLEGI